MAKKQTRRSVSLSRAVYDAAVKLAAERGVSLASLVELGLRSQGLEAPEGMHYDPVARAYVGNDAAKERNMDAAREAIAVRIAERHRGVVCSFAEIERRQREHEAKAIANPCRAEYCRIQGLHPADDQRHSKKIAARSGAR